MKLIEIRRRCSRRACFNRAGVCGFLAAGNFCPLSADDGATDNCNYADFARCGHIALTRPVRPSSGIVRAPAEQ